jgi:hypothetical protein
MWPDFTTMSFPNESLPVHRRANRENALEAIRNRYRRCREVAGAQVAVLQHDKAFLVEAHERYAAGYKDWHILGGIINAMWNQVAFEKRIDLTTLRPTSPENPRQVVDQATGRVFPIELFLGDHLEGAITGFEFVCLASFGFFPRSGKAEVELVRKFLRNRMRFYEFDIEHPPLFGQPLGEWPEL